PQALAGVALGWDDFTRPRPIADLTADEQVRTVAARSDVLQALVAYDQAEADLRGEVAKQYPSITVGPGYTWERGLVKLPFALGLALPSWDLNHRAIAAAEARRARAGAAIESTLANAQQAIDTARAELSTAGAALTRIRGSELPEARLAAERADRQLALGAIGRSEWLAAWIAEGEARRNELEALVRLRAAEAGLEEAVRRPLQGPETGIVSYSAEGRP
ncbi:MAG TPA: TolC family protein, partial [Novosphingobium sp.]